VGLDYVDLMPPHDIFEVGTNPLRFVDESERRQYVMLSSLDDLHRYAGLAYFGGKRSVGEGAHDGSGSFRSEMLNQCADDLLSTSGVEVAHDMEDPESFDSRARIAGR
jgi:hypothetical protein